MLKCEYAAKRTHNHYIPGGRLPKAQNSRGHATEDTERDRNGNGARQPAKA